MTVSFFNPWHDMALANGTPHYQPPAFAIAMAADLAHLARLWEEEGSVTVWGWDPLVVHLLARRGVPRDMMPGEEELQHIRRLSSRLTAVKALPVLSHEGGEGLPQGATPGFKSRWCGSEDELLSVIEEWDEELTCRPAFQCENGYILKSPWSCSGKGLMRVEGLSGMGAVPRAWARNIIRRQGGVVIEPYYTAKRHDCAIEYETRGGRAACLGLSLFDTVAGAYTGNIMDSEEGKLRRLGIASLQHVIDRHLAFIDSEIAPHYSGPLGIDMMVMDDGAVHPCVEINLRRTMGWVALQLERTAQRLPAVFRIIPGKRFTDEIIPLEKDKNLNTQR